MPDPFRPKRAQASPNPVSHARPVDGDLAAEVEDDADQLKAEAHAAHRQPRRRRKAAK